jgi:predicted Fe-Mo cluster-binding NifX family protein
MKIAVAIDGGMVAQHFGHCEGFEIFNVQGKQILDKNFVKNPGHRPGFLPNFLGDLGTEVILAGGMGGGAIEIFNERGIQVLTGIQGGSQENVEKFLRGELQSTGSVCREHQGNCEE